MEQLLVKIKNYKKDIELYELAIHSAQNELDELITEKTDIVNKYNKELIMYKNLSQMTRQTQELTQSIEPNESYLNPQDDKENIINMFFKEDEILWNHRLQRKKRLEQYQREHDDNNENSDINHSTNKTTTLESEGLNSQE